MKNLHHTAKRSAWSMALLALMFNVGCSSGKWDSSEPTGTQTPVIPTVTAFYPGDKAANVATTTTVTVTFNTSMDEASLNDTTFTLTDPESSPVMGDISYSETNRTATFLPDNDLSANTTYTAAVTEDVQTVTGESLTRERVWSFTTAAAGVMPAALDVSATNPGDEGTGVCTDRSVSATFSDPLDPSSINSPAVTFTLVETLTASSVEGDVTVDADGTTATFTPNSDLDVSVAYTARITTAAEGIDGDLLEKDVVWSFTTSNSVCQQPIDLGAAAPFGVLSNTGVTLGGGPNSTTGLRIDGDVGIFDEGSCIGCDTTTVSGLREIGSSTAETAMTALAAAYDEATGRATSVCTLIDSGALTTNPATACGGGANGVFAPGLYWSGSSISIPAGGTITLDGGNDNDAVFIFQSESTVNTIGGGTHIILVNGAQAKNVFWVAQSSATIGGTDSDFSGTVIALIGVTVNTGTNMVGRALAMGAEVVVQDQARITVPTE